MYPAFYSFIGMAVGDAVGTTNEFETVEAMARKPRQTEMVGGGPFRLRKGEWTDDTAMALAMACSIIVKQDVDLVDISQQFYKWAQSSVEENRELPSFYSSNGTLFDIGNQTLLAVANFKESKFKNPVAEFHEGAGGNGSMMRLAPVPMLLHKHPHMAIEFSGYSSLTSHNHGGAVDSCRYLAALIVGAIQGATKEQLLQRPFVPKGLQSNYWEQNPVCKDVYDVIMSTHDEAVAPINSGGAVGSLKAVLWHLKRANSFEEGVLNISNLGKDSDTIAAIYGQVAGPLYRSIRQDWVDALSMSSFLQAVSVTLCLMAEQVEFASTSNQSRKFFVGRDVNKSQNTDRDTYGRPGNMMISMNPQLLQPMTLTLRYYNHLVENGSDYNMEISRTNVLSTLLAGRLVRDIRTSMLSWRNVVEERPPLRLATSQLEEFGNVSELMSVMFYEVLSDTSSLEHHRLSAGPVRVVFKLKFRADPKVLNGHLFATLVQLNVLISGLVAQDVLSHCVDYTFHVVHNNMKNYMEMSWVMRPQERVDEVQVLRNALNMVQADIEGVLSPYQSFVHSFANFNQTLELRNSGFDFSSLRQQLLQLKVWLDKDVVFVPQIAQLLYTSNTFVNDSSPCPQEVQLPAGLSMFHNYSLVYPMPGSVNGGVHGYNKLYAATTAEKCWLLLHLQLQNMHLRKMKQCEHLCLPLPQDSALSERAKNEIVREVQESFNLQKKQVFTDYETSLSENKLIHGLIDEPVSELTQKFRANLLTPDEYEREMNVILVQLTEAVQNIVTARKTQFSVLEEKMAIGFFEGDVQRMLNQCPRLNNDQKAELQTMVLMQFRQELQVYKDQNKTMEWLFMRRESLLHSLKQELSAKGCDLEPHPSAAETKKEDASPPSKVDDNNPVQMTEKDKFLTKVKATLFSCKKMSDSERESYLETVIKEYGKRNDVNEFMLGMIGCSPSQKNFRKSKMVLDTLEPIMLYKKTIYAQFPHLQNFLESTQFTESMATFTFDFLENNIDFQTFVGLSRLHQNTIKSIVDLEHDSSGSAKANIIHALTEPIEFLKTETTKQFPQLQNLFQSSLVTKRFTEATEAFTRKEIDLQTYLLEVKKQEGLIESIVKEERRKQEDLNADYVAVKQDAFEVQKNNILAKTTDRLLIYNLNARYNKTLLRLQKDYLFNKTLNQDAYDDEVEKLLQALADEFFLKTSIRIQLPNGEQCSNEWLETEKLIVANTLQDAISRCSKGSTTHLTRLFKKLNQQFVELCRGCKNQFISKTQIIQSKAEIYSTLQNELRTLRCEVEIHEQPPVIPSTQPVPQCADDFLAKEREEFVEDVTFLFNQCSQLSDDLVEELLQKYMSDFNEVSEKCKTGTKTKQELSDTKQIIYAVIQETLKQRFNCDVIIDTYKELCSSEFITQEKRIVANNITTMLNNCLAIPSDQKQLFFNRYVTMFDQLFDECKNGILTKQKVQILKPLLFVDIQKELKGHFQCDVEEIPKVTSRTVVPLAETKLKPFVMTDLELLTKEEMLLRHYFNKFEKVKFHNQMVQMIEYCVFSSNLLNFVKSEFTLYFDNVQNELASGWLNQQSLANFRNELVSNIDQTFGCLLKSKVLNNLLSYESTLTNQLQNNSIQQDTLLQIQEQVMANFQEPSNEVCTLKPDLKLQLTTPYLARLETAYKQFTETLITKDQYLSEKSDILSALQLLLEKNNNNCNVQLPIIEDQIPVPPEEDVELPPDFLTEDQVIQKVEERKDSSPEDSSHLQLGFSRPAITTTTDARVPFTKITVFHRGVTSQEVQRHHKTNIDSIVKKYFHGIKKKTNYVSSSSVSEVSSLDLIFIVGNPDDFSALYDFVKLWKLLKETGSLILMSTAVHGDQSLYSHQLKNTVFKNPGDQFDALKTHFVSFYSGHVFYMKRLLKDEDVQVGDETVPAETSPAFATFHYPHNYLQPFVILTQQPSASEELFKITRTDTMVPHIVQVMPDEIDRLGALPMNYVMGRRDSTSLLTELNTWWSEVLDAAEINRDTADFNNPVVKKLSSLNLYFLSFQVRGGGKCAFLALNALFALKDMVLLDKRSVLVSANKLLEDLADVQDPSVWYHFSTFELFATTIQEAQQSLIEDFNHNTPSVYWLQVVAHARNIRIVVFTVISKELVNRPLNKPEIFIPYFLLPSEIKVLPTFFLLNKDNHYYPLFPVRDIPSSETDEFNIQTV